MSKASDRIYDEYPKGVDAVEYVLAKIRARRERIFEHQKNGPDARLEFWQLLDDDAEFGPDKPEPEYDFVEHDGAMRLFRNGCFTRDVPIEEFNAIKKLGAEEAKDE